MGQQRHLLDLCLMVWLVVQSYLQGSLDPTASRQLLLVSVDQPLSSAVGLSQQLVVQYLFVEGLMLRHQRGRLPVPASFAVKEAVARLQRFQPSVAILIALLVSSPGPLTMAVDNS